MHTYESTAFHCCCSGPNIGPRPLTLEIEDSLVVLENLDCHGTESKLIECSEGDHSICENNQTVGVICRAGMCVLTRCVSFVKYYSIVYILFSLIPRPPPFSFFGLCSVWYMEVAEHVLQWTQTEERKQGRPGNKAIFCSLYCVQSTVSIAEAHFYMHFVDAWISHVS